MHRLRILAVLVAAIAMLATARPAFAHPLGNFTINHLSRIAIDEKRIAVRFVVDYAEIPAFAEERAVDASGTMTARERDAWAQAQAKTRAKDLLLTVDGSPLPLAPVRARATRRPGSGGLATLYLVVDYAAPLAPGAHTIAYVDRAFPGRIGWRDVVFGSEREPTAMLTQYPDALVGSPRAIASASFALAADGRVTRALASASERSGAGSTAASSAPQIAAANIARSNQLGDMLARDDSSLGFFFTIFGIAIVLGALHAMEPGHGKTLMAVSLVGARATIPQAAMLAGAITVAHTAGVLALGAVILVAANRIVPETIYPWITLGTGLIVAVLGARTLARIVQARRPQKHAHAHAHPAAREHVHDHVHGIGMQDHHEPHHHDHETSFDPVAAARNAFAAHGHDHGAMTDEEHARAHAIPGTEAIGFRSVVAAAMTGGIAPCPAALVVLLTAVNVQKIALGLTLIVAFSFGLAMVLVTVGIAVVRGSALLVRSSRFAFFTRYGSFVSASIIATIGSVMVGEGLAAQGVGGSPLLLAALTLLAIVGYAFGSHASAHRGQGVPA